MHRIAITQLRLAGPGRDYLQRRITAGDTKTEASGRCAGASLMRSTAASKPTSAHQAGNPLAFYQQLDIDGM
jgi:hypothetical protein